MHILPDLCRWTQPGCDRSRTCLADVSVFILHVEKLTVVVAKLNTIAHIFEESATIVATAGGTIKKDLAIGVYWQALAVTLKLTMHTFVNTLKLKADTTVSRTLVLSKLTARKGATCTNSENT